MMETTPAHTIDVINEVNAAYNAANDRGARITADVVKFMQETGLEASIGGALEMLSDYLHLCVSVENIADQLEANADLDGVQWAEDMIATIKEEYLPSFRMLHDPFYRVKELINFLLCVGETEQRTRK